MPNHEDGPLEHDVDVLFAAAPLIRALREEYPARCIRVGEAVEAAHHYAGKVSLVEELNDLLDQYEEQQRAFATS